jgi:hypothetical protein
MLPAALLYLAMFFSSLTETPYVAYDLATHMSKAQRVEWTKMTDDENNVRFTITFHKMPILAELGFERTFVDKHNNCQTELNKKK